jgi:hypothetical protein
MTRTSIVVRPMSVRPVSTGPTQAKCSSQMSWRGWKSLVSKLVSGSETCDVRPLVEVVIQAGQRQVLGDSRSVVLLGNDVVDLEGQNVERLRQPTVFAGVFGAVPNQTFQCLVHRVRRQGKRARPKRSEPWRGSG